MRFKVFIRAAVLFGFAGNTLPQLLRSREEQKKPPPECRGGDQVLCNILI